MQHWLERRTQQALRAEQPHKPTDELVHRLQLLGVDWGQLEDSERGMGTFRETLQLCWQPELSVELVAANVYGTTVEQAAANKLAESARTADLPGLTELIERALLARLPQSVTELAAELDTRAGRPQATCACSWKRSDHWRASSATAMYARPRPSTCDRC